MPRANYYNFAVVFHLTFVTNQVTNSVLADSIKIGLDLKYINLYVST